MREYLELTEKIHAEEREVIKKLINIINDLNADEIQYKEIIRIRSKIKQTSKELTGLENFGHMLFYIEDDYWDDNERIERAKRMA